jgi:ketosteroid isomerase-like protein
MRTLSAEARVILVVVILCFTAGIGGSWIVGDVFERQLEGTSTETMDAALHEFQEQERVEVEKLSATLDALLACPDMAAAFAARDRARLLALATPRFEQMRARDRITHWYFVEAPPSSRVFLRVHAPDLHGDAVARTTFLKAVETGERGAGKELGQTAFALRVVRPWVREGKIIGYMELAEEIDHFLTNMKAHTGDDYGILVKKEFLDERAWSQILGARANTWNDRPDVVVVDTTIFNLGITDYQGSLGDIPDSGLQLGEIDVEDRSWIRALYPLKDAADRKVGGLFVLHDFTASHRAIRTAMLTTLFVMVGFAVVTAAILTIALRRFIFLPLARLADRVERAADDAGVPHERVLVLGRRDKLVRIEALYERLLDALRRPPTGGARPRAGNGEKHT